MKAGQSSLITRIALLVIFVEMIAFGAIGWFYIDRFSSAADEQARSRLQLVGQLIAQEELQIDAVARTSLMSDLLGANYREGVVIGGNGRIIVSTDAAFLGRTLQQIADFEPEWIAGDAPELQYIDGANALTCVMRIDGSQSRSLYHIIITIDTTELNARKRSILILGWSASLVFILLSSVGIILLAHRFIGRRVDNTLKALKQVETGAMDVRIPVKSLDEMGQLQLGINSMIETLGTLLSRHRRNEEELSAIINSISEGLIAVDMSARIVRFNANAQELLGGVTQVLQGRHLTDYLPELANEDQPPWQSALVDGETLDSIHWTHPGRNGNQRSMAMDCGPVRDTDGAVIGAVLVLRDITERQAAEEQQRLAANVFTHAREGIVITDTQGTIVNVNKAFAQITGYPRDEVIGKNPRILKSELHSHEFYVAMWRSLVEQGYWIGEIWNRRKNSELYAEMLTISAVRDARGETQHYVGLFFDITVQKAQQQQLEYSAHYDALTHLPNRVLLADQLHQAMAQARRRGQLLAVVYLDLDGFKTINDRYGHDTGDRLLIAVAQRMKESLREGDTIARLGGDEFVAVLIDLPDMNASEPLLKRLLTAVAQPVHTDDVELRVSASLGITFYPQAEEVEADQLLRQADQAMYQAKLAGRNRYQLFDAEQDRNVRGHHESVESIRRGIELGEFVLHYQPQVNMRTGDIVGVEALIRWQHAERGLLLPDAFLPVIEDNPIAIELNEWVLDTALTQLDLWHADGMAISVSVNVCALQLQQPDFIDRVRELLAAHPRVKPGDLKLEVLETSALNDMGHVSQVIAACERIGVSFALDDFGTGYSSLTYLKRLPATQLKIDQTFVRDMLDDPEDLAILEGTLSLATAFHRQVIAEGVESRAHGEMLLQLGCELGQGFGIARPMSANDMRKWVAIWRQHAPWIDQAPVTRDELPLLFAGVELRAWFRGFEECLKDECPARPADLADCRFGRWVCREGHARYGTTQEFREIESLHLKMHALAEEMVKNHLRGHRSMAIERLPEVQELKDRMLQQMKLLREDEQRKRVADGQMGPM